jgi:hypothetical protein
MTIASNRVFLFVHLRAASGGWQALNKRANAALAGWPAVIRVGSFMGLFGISNQALFVLLSLPAGEDGRTELRARLPADIELVDTLALRATARPSDDAPLTRAGVYVFRFFDVGAADVAEVVALSRIAWQTFELDAQYAAEPMGLFRFDDPSAERGRMMLLTWYDNLTSWERSRTPHPEATANFQRRAALSRSALAIATRLIA